MALFDARHWSELGKTYTPFACTSNALQSHVFLLTYVLPTNTYESYVSAYVDYIRMCIIKFHNTQYNLYTYITECTHNKLMCNDIILPRCVAIAGIDDATHGQVGIVKNARLPF